LRVIGDRYMTGWYLSAVMQVLAEGSL
jgi:hypothetical protein